MQYSETLYTLIGRVRDYKPNATPEQITGWINSVLRNIQDRRPYWSDSIARGMISIPDIYRTGTVSVATGSPIVTGSTAWPVNDLVNTTLQQQIPGTGSRTAVPASMAGITEDSILMVDAGTPAAESVAVLRVGGNSFAGSFRFAHPAGATLQCSSLAGRQFRLNQGYPIFMVMGVRSATELELELPWGANPQTGAAYQILKMWVTLAPGLRKIHGVVDQQQARPLGYNFSQTYVNIRDPQRTQQGDPLLLADYMPSPSGNMQYEVWPAPQSARQISFAYSRSWPELKRVEDRGPAFINPELLINGAVIRALRTKIAAKDPFYDPRLASEMIREFNGMVDEAINADESRAVQEYTNVMSSLFPQGMGALGGANYWQARDPSVASWDM